MARAIVFALKQSETGVAVAEVCRKMGISEAGLATFDWRVFLGRFKDLLKFDYYETTRI
ncbi:transposase [Larkinella bovis]|uniref:Transposase n=1 Tax=Larkinella bovis TaxID=683041 RepID=A0ABW0IGA3_9BACT